MGRNKLVIADQPSKIKAEQTVSTKKFLAVGAVGGFVVVVGVFFCALSCRFNKESKKKLGLIKQRNKEYGSKTFTDTKSDYIYR